MSDQTPNQIDASKTLKDLQSEFSTLDRVSHRLALTEAGAALEKVLHLLLPRLLSRIGKNDDAKKESRRGVNKRKLSSTSSNTNVEVDGIQDQLDGMYETIHNKLIEMLMHIMKRVREDRTCKLPCSAILELLLPEKEAIVSAFTVNLSLAYLTLGVNRCTPVECCSMLPGLMRFLESLLVQNKEFNGQQDNSSVGVGFLLDASRKMRYNQTWHLILRCLEHVSYNPLENAAARRAVKSESSVSSQSGNATTIQTSSLADTKDLLLSNPVISAAIFDLFLDVLLYAPVQANSTLIPNGMSTVGYQCLVGGAASENSGCKSWKEEFATRAKLKELKLKFLDLVAPCRRFAIFLPDKPTNESASVDDYAVKSLDATNNLEGLGMSRTVALMVLLSGDADLDVKSKAESYLRAHMDTYRGKETPAGSTEEGFNKVNDSLLGNQVVLANSLLAYVAGGVSSNVIVEKVLLGFESQTASIVAKSRLGMIYHKIDNNDAQQKAALSCCRMKISDTATVSGLKFVAKMLEDNPKLFHVGLDMENDEADIAAVSIGSLAVNIFGDLWKPGSSGSSAVEAAASVLNALCLRLAFFYESRQQFDSKQSGSSGRLQVLLARSLVLACAVLSPTSSGESTTLSNNGTRTSTSQVEIRDKMYGVVCTLARSHRFSLNESYSLMDCGNSEGASSFTSTSTASLLFGCATNEIEMLRPRASSALDALLSAYVRAVTSLLEKNKPADMEVKEVPSANPWASALSSKSTDAVNSNKRKQPSIIDSLSRSLLPLLWNASRCSQPKSSRLSAARWAHELLLHINPKQAFHLLCFLSGDDDATVSSIAKKALAVDSTIGEDISLSSLESTSDELSSFSEIAETILGEESISSRPTYEGFHARSQAATLRFLLQLLLSEDSYYGDDKLKEYVSTILRTLANYKSRSLTRDEADLLDECSICLAGCTSSSQDARLVVIDKSDGFGLEDIADQTITSSSSKARRHFAEVMRYLYGDQSLWNNTLDSSTGSFSVSSWINVTGLLHRATLCREKVGTMIHSSHVLGEVHGAAYLGASCVYAFLAMSQNSVSDETDPRISQCWEVCSSIIALFGKGISHAELTIGSACSQGLMIAFGYNGQEAPALDPRLYGSMAVVLDEMNSALKKFSSIDHADPTRASSLIHAAGVLLAASSTGAGVTSSASLTSSVELGPSRLQCIESLFAVVGSAVHRKEEELSLAVGEALVKYADAIGYGEWSATSDLVWESGSYDESFALSLPPHKHIVYTTFKREIVSNNPVKKAGCAALLLAIVGHASRLSIMDKSLASRTMIQEVFKHLEKFQLAFIQLLSDPKSKQLARECCCKGLAACRGLSLACKSSEGSSPDALSDTLNERLLKAFGKTSNFGGSAMMETAVQARERRNQGDEGNALDVQQTEVGGVAGMGEAELGAFREMANASIALDRPDILYTLMILATNHPIWLASDARDRYSSKSLLGSSQGLNDGEIRTALRPHIGKLIPSLLRACNDPNKQTREQMNALWVSLSGGGAEARDLISRHLLPTLDTLTNDAVSKLWRARAGACGALADMIVGRSWDDLGGGDAEDDEGEIVSKGAAIRLLRLWKCTVRALDDVRSPVRECGETLGRAVRALTIRLCDPLATNITAEEEAYMSNAERERHKRQNEVNAEKAATVSLGWLVKDGLNQPCAEATGIAISCLLGIVDVAKPSTLQPVLDSLVGTLLMAMSGLEPAALNYLQVRAAGNVAGHGNSNDSYDRLEAARVRLAQSGPIYEALNKCISMIRHIDLDAQKKIVPELDGALRRGAGFATRAATADAVTSLCSTCPNAFKFPGLSTTNPTVRLLRALYYASEKERGASSKDKMTHALGSLAELAPGKAVRALASRACERYSESSGSNSDSSVRKAAASTIRAIVVRATSHLQDGDVWVNVVLPTSYLGRHDNDPKIASLWNDVWEEGGTAIGNREDMFGTLPQERLLPQLTKVIIQNLLCNAWSNRLAACAVLTELADANILAPPPSSVDESCVPEGSKERFRIRAAASRSCLAECVRIIQRRRVWNGKGEVVKAAALIGGKWASVAPLNESTSLGVSMDCFPLVIRTDCPDELFEGDLWFKESGSEANGVDEQEATSSDEKDNGDENNVSENETALDFTDEPNIDDEEPTLHKSNEAVEEAKPLTHSGFCRLLCDQGLWIRGNVSTEGVLPYKSAALAGLSSFLRAIVATKNSSEYKEVVSHQRLIYNMLAPQLYSFISSSQEGDKTTPPLLVAKALECLASAFYDDVGDDLSPDFANSLIMLKFLTECSGVNQPAWTVRQSAVLAASSLVTKMSSKRLIKNEAITTALDCSSQALKDRKFWKVRQAGLELLLSLVNRVGKQKVSAPDPDNQMLMESILPYKEKITGLARQSLSDNESQVTAVASKVTMAMSWWP